MDAGSPLDLAVLGNCQVAALIDRLGRIVWLCLPRPDADPTFCALLTAEGGAAGAGPQGAGGAGPGAAGAGGAAGGKDDVVDAEFEEVKDKDRRAS